MSTTAEVRLWGTSIGAVSLAGDARVASFEYDPNFAASGIEVSPLKMPLAARRRYGFPGLAQESFSGLPGMLADSLPDHFGEALLDALVTREEGLDDFNAVKRLCYIGKRGMGALEFFPAAGPGPAESHVLDVEALVELAAEVMSSHAGLEVIRKEPGKREAVRDILRVGTSAGGARPKALIALNPVTREVRSGQLDVPPGFEHWILKFDGVEDESRDLGTSRGYGAVEWVYSRMARKAGIEMTECDLLEEGGRRHFMTRRFDRAGGDKLHMQSLAALAHLDYNQAGANSHEQAFQAIRELELPREATEQQFRRMVFNVVARNQDDHVKNIAFLMDRGGNWSLSPAFDVVYAFNPEGRQTRLHQMSINGKRENFTVADLRQVGKRVGLRRGEADEILGEVTAAVRSWPETARGAGLDEPRIARIAKAHRLTLPLS